MRKLMNTLALVALATVSQAQIVRTGTYEGDSFIYAVNGSSDTGYVNVKWSGYATPNQGNAGWRVVVWDMTSPQNPIANETYHASSREGSYSRTFTVTPYAAVRVELYAVADQFANSNMLSSTVTTSMWVQPAGTMVGTSYAYPTNYDYPPIVTTGYPVQIVPAPIHLMDNYYPAIVGAYTSYRRN